MTEPSWLAKARTYLGMAEIHGPHHNPKVVALWAKAHAGNVDDDETPWCAAFVSAVLEESGIKSARSGWARSYLKWGTNLLMPAVGCIVVFERGPNSGHVGFVVGRDRALHLMVLGGNQGDMVKIAPFERSRVLGYRWPAGVAGPVGGLPVVDSDGHVSSNEA